MDGDGSYAAMLRVIGAYLDDHSARFLSLIELPDALAVRYANEHGGETATARFTGDDLSLSDRQAKRDRARVQLRRTREVVKPEGATYQDFLRALGYQLDRAEAHSILIDQADEGLFVSFQNRDADGGFVWRKRLVRMGAPEQRTLLEAAHARRDPGLALFRFIRVNTAR